jgi:hypothetical protein
MMLQRLYRSKQGSAKTEYNDKRQFSPWMRFRAPNASESVLSDSR